MKTNVLKRNCAKYTAPQEALAKGIYPYYKPIESEQSTVVKIKGKDVLMFGSLGGFIAADFDIINYLKHNARSLIFSASMPPSNVAAVSKAIDIMLSEPERIEHLWDLSDYARCEFKERGFDIGLSETPIIPLFVRNSEKAFWLCNRLLDDGVSVTPVIAPAVPENDALIRFALMATHTYEQVDEAIDKITKAFKEANMHCSTLLASP